MLLPPSYSITISFYHYIYHVSFHSCIAPFCNHHIQFSLSHSPQTTTFYYNIFPLSHSITFALHYHILSSLAQSVPISSHNHIPSRSLPTTTFSHNIIPAGDSWPASPFSKPLYAYFTFLLLLPSSPSLFTLHLRSFQFLSVAWFMQFLTASDV